MNQKEESQGVWTPVWPGRRAALLRLLLITSVVFPLSWAVNALLVGSWNLLGDRNAESVRHLIEWQVIWIATVAVVFLVSLLPRFRGLMPRLNPRRWFFALVCVATLAVLFYVEENWRGARAWSKYRQQLEASGAQLDLAAFIPKPVPDDQNFAATPFIRSWFEGENRGRADKLWNDDFTRASGIVWSSPTNKDERQFTDLVAWEKAFAAVQSGQTNEAGDLSSGKLDRASRAQAAPGVLQGFKASETKFNELRAASRRPYSHYPVVYDLENPWGILLPHIAVIRSTCQRLQIKACAELAADHSDRALEDVDLMLRMTDSLKDESFLVSYLVRAACVQLAIQPIWEGLADRTWSETQLQEIQSRLQQYDFVTDMKPPLESERAAGILTAELVRKKGLGFLVELIGPGPPTSLDRKFANWCGGFIPEGWFYLEQVTYCRLYQMQIEGIDPGQKRISPERIAAATRELDREIAGGRLGKTVSGFLNHRIIAALLLPALNRIPVKASVAQTAADEAMLACALERFRLANGSYPETLAALAPKFIAQIPTDTITGKSYNYRRTEEGRFILYSVGWDAVDHGGRPGKKLFDETEADWVWQYPVE